MPSMRVLQGTDVLRKNEKLLKKQDKLSDMEKPRFSRVCYSAENLNQEEKKGRFKL